VESVEIETHRDITHSHRHVTHSRPSMGERKLILAKVAWFSRVALPKKGLSEIREIRENNRI